MKLDVRDPKTKERLSELDAGELREWTAEAMCKFPQTYSLVIGFAIDRLEQISETSLPQILRDLADDIEVLDAERR